MNFSQLKENREERFDLCARQRVHNGVDYIYQDVCIHKSIYYGNKTTTILLRQDHLYGSFKSHIFLRISWWRGQAGIFSAPLV